MNYSFGPNTITIFCENNHGRAKGAVESIKSSFVSWIIRGDFRVTTSYSTGYHLQLTAIFGQMFTCWLLRERFFIALKSSATVSSTKLLCIMNAPNFKVVWVRVLNNQSNVRDAPNELCSFAIDGLSIWSDQAIMDDFNLQPFHSKPEVQVEKSELNTNFDGSFSHFLDINWTIMLKIHCSSIVTDPSVVMPMIFSRLRFLE